MKISLTLLLTFTMITGFSQTIPVVYYKDTVNKFSISIPGGWQYGVNKAMPRIKLIARRNTVDQPGEPYENFNLNIIEKKNPSTLDREYNTLIEMLSSTNDFTLLEKGDTTMHEQPFKWFIEKHKEPAPLHNYVFITYKEGKTYILTFVAGSAWFEKYRPVFRELAGTFIL